MCFPRRFLYLSPRHTVRLKEVAMAANWTPFQVIRSPVRPSFARGDACLETLLHTCPWREPAAPELFRVSRHSIQRAGVGASSPFPDMPLLTPCPSPESPWGGEGRQPSHYICVHLLLRSPPPKLSGGSGLLFSENFKVIVDLR